MRSYLVFIVFGVKPETLFGDWDIFLLFGGVDVCFVLLFEIWELCGGIVRVIGFN